MNNNNPYWREESRIYNLEYEIAKTDDPEKRQRLEALLEKERQALYQKMNYNRSRRELEQDTDDSGSFGWWLLGFLLPVVGLILWIVWHRKKPNNAHASIWGAITSVVTGIALVIIAFFVGLRITDMSFDAIKNNNAASTTIVSSQSEPKLDEVDTKKLSQEQVKKWVYYHMKKDNPNISGSSAYDFSIVPNQDSELEISVSSGGTPVNDYLIDSSGDLYNISSGQKTLLSKNWDVPNNFELDEPTQTLTSSTLAANDTSFSSQSQVNSNNISDEKIRSEVANIVDNKWKNASQKHPYEIVINRDTPEKGIINIVVNPTDVQTDAIDAFRINKNGELEESSRFVPPYKMGDWIPIDTATQTQADEVRNIMIKNQNLDPNVLNSISDEEILAANAGNATNSQIAETAQNLINKYPALKK